MFQTVFQTEILEIEIFSRVKFFRGTQSFFGQNGQNSEKVTKSKNFGGKSFLVGIDSEQFETYFKTKISKLKIFFHVIFFSWDFVVFSQNDQNSEKMPIQKMLVEIFFWVGELRMGGFYEWEEFELKSFGGGVCFLYSSPRSEYSTTET